MYILLFLSWLLFFCCFFVRSSTNPAPKVHLCVLLTFAFSFCFAPSPCTGSFSLSPAPTSTSSWFVIRNLWWSLTPFVHIHMLGCPPQNFLSLYMFSVLLEIMCRWHGTKHLYLKTVQACATSPGSALFSFEARRLVASTAALGRASSRTNGLESWKK